MKSATCACVAAEQLPETTARAPVAAGKRAASSLGVTQLRIGTQIDPGVPWCHAAQRKLHLALKSGNFGGVDFFSRAFETA